MKTAEQVAADLQATFEAIRIERMHDVPILNNDLAVETVGFRDWQGQVVGILVTPWCMNIMMLPAASDDWPPALVGTKTMEPLPSGQYEFIAGDEPGVGQYRMCSLFSPMFEFEDQAAAVATAESAIQELMTEEEPDEETSQQPAPVSRRDLFRGIAAGRE